MPTPPAGRTTGVLERSAPPGPALGVLDMTYEVERPNEFWGDVDTLGIGLVRGNLRWADVARAAPRTPRDPADPAYDWALPDTLVRAAVEHGATPLLTFWATPSWAARYPGYDNVNGVPRTAAFRDFVAAAVRRYSGGFDPDAAGPVPPLPRVARWEVWNEPNYYLYPARQDGRITVVRDYVELLNAAYAEIKDAGRRGGYGTIVIGGAMAKTKPAGTALAPLNFVRLMREAGAQLDAVSVHPYPLVPQLGARDGGPEGGTTAPNIGVGNFARLTEEVDRLWPGRRLPIWITEFGIESRPEPTRLGVSTADQARFLGEAYEALRGPGNRVAAIVWFLLRDEPVRYPDGRRGWQSGVRGVDGRPKPLYDAWRALASVRSALSGGD